MADAPKPGQLRKQQERKLVLVIAIDGVDHHLRVADLGPRDDQRCIEATGRPCVAWLSTNPAEAGLYGLAVMVWLARCQAGEAVSLDEVMDNNFPSYADLGTDRLDLDARTLGEDVADPLERDAG